MPTIWSVIRENDDNVADVRVSLGKKKNLGAYIVFRGEPEETIRLLDEALKEARLLLPTDAYEDRRGTLQG